MPSGTSKYVPTETGSGVIVVVEDPFVRNFLRNVLERQGYEVLSGGVGHGLAAMRDGRQEVQLLITNVPSAFTEFAGRVPLLYLAALPDPSLASPYRRSRILSKPFHPHDLLASVQELLQPMITPRAGVDGVVDSLLFAQHAIEMFRRSVPKGSSRNCLDRLSNRLTKILSEARKLKPPRISRPTAE
jgi:hypothetical protein